MAQKKRLVPMQRHHAERAFRRVQLSKAST